MRRTLISISLLAASAASMPAAGAQVAYGPAETVSVGAWAYGTEIADVTGDGRLDLIVTTLGEVDPAWDWKVLVYAQQEDGTLAAPVAYDPNGTEPNLFPAVGDLDGDDDTDLVVSQDGGIDVFAQAGGVLTGPTSYPAPAAVFNVEVADLDDDGLDDVVYSVHGETSFTYVGRLQQDDGTLGEAVEIGTGPSEYFEMGDVNDDGRPDLVVEWPALELEIHVQQADGTFVETTDARTGGPRHAAVADVTGDGILDLVLGLDSGLSVMAGDGSGGLSDPVAEGPAGVFEVVDVDGDSLLDAVIVGSSTFVLTQDGAGGLDPACGFDAVYHGGSGTRESLAAGDLNGDARADLVAAGLADPFWISYQLADGETVGASMNILGPTSATYGDEIEIGGTLTIDGGCIEVESVDLWRSAGGGPFELVGSDELTLTSDGLRGSYEFTDVVPAAGEITYHVTWGGTDIHQPVTSPDLVLIADKLQTRLTLTGDKAIVYGDDTVLTATLRGIDEAEVSFFEIRPSGAERLLATKPVNRQGKAKLIVSPSANTRYIARFEESDVAKESTDSLLVKVSVFTTGKMTHYSYKSGGYAVYDCCRSYFWFKVAPNHAGKAVKVMLQVYLSGAWRSYDPWSFKLKPNSTAEIFIDVNGGTGYRFRVKACMPKHADHLGDCSPKVYFRYS
jgi:hypothetical protein